MESISESKIKKGLVYAIIPARSGSKGIKDKNIKEIEGHPLMAFSIAAARLCSAISRVIVSTDSEEYATIATSYGAEAPFLRPQIYSGDTATDLEFMEHALHWFSANENVLPEYWVHLRVTCPIRNPQVINDAICNIKAFPEATSLLSICVPKGVSTPYKWMVKDDKYIRSIFFENNDDANLPRQSYPVAYMRTIYVDILKTETILSSHRMFGDRIIPFETVETNDIDTEYDFEIVKAKIIDKNLEVLDYLDRIQEKRNN